jgi:YegS/Rv2252/BmrU family lipid kinase
MPTPEQRGGVVVNPTKAGSDQMREAIDKVFADAGLPAPEYRETTPEDAGCGVAKDLLDAGCTPLLVAGGDGTVREVCTATAGTGTPVVIIPLGTGNLLARNLDLPLEPASALAAVAAGTDRRIDLARVEGDNLPADGYVVMAGMGFDAAMMADAPEGLKARIGALAYVVSGLRHLRDRAFTVELTVDGETSTHTARMVLVGNVGALQGGIRMLPDATPDDGALDVAVLAPRRLRDWLHIAWHVVRRSRHTDHRLVRRCGKHIQIRATRAVARELDGDPVRMGRELDIRADAGAVVIRGPR